MKIWRLNRFLLRTPVDTKCASRSFLPALVGLCLGITVSMMYAPFSEDSCETFLARQDPQKMIKLRETKSLDSGKEEEMYEPRQLEVPADSANYKLDSKAGSKFYRPKFAATELGIREKLLVAVLSSKDSLNTRAVALNKTLAHFVTRTVFFIDQKASVPPPPGMLIVNFSDGYNHLLPIAVLKYVSAKYGHDYDYFMFITDHAYVRAEKIMDLVTHISVSKHVHLGSPRGVEQGSTYCSLDGGVILSQSILSVVNATANMKWCSDKCHHSDQSLNLGKCVLHTAQMECQATVAGKQYTSHPVKDFNFDRDIEALREQTEFNKSISVFPMPDERTHFKLHRYFCEVELNATFYEIQEMKDNILYMSQFAPGGRDSVSWPVGVPESYKPKNRFDVIRWDYFTETHIFFQDDFTNVKELVGVDKLDIQDIIKVSMEKLNAKHNNIYLYSYLINGYRRFDPQRGMEYILDLALEDTSIVSEDGSNNDRVVEKRVFLVRPLGEVEVVPMPYVTENTKIRLVLPITMHDTDGWGLFVENYSKIKTEAGSIMSLIVVFIYDEAPKAGQEDRFSVLRSMLSYYDGKNDADTKSIALTVVSNKTYVSELTIIDMVSSHKSVSDDTLLFMCTVGMQLNMEMLNRVRINTIPGWQVFFPVGFWQFKPNLIYDKKPYPTDIDFNSKTGHYDVLSYEHGSFYNSDYKEARKSLTGSELASFDIFEMFVNFGKLHVFRAVEPEFKHFYQHLECLPNSPGKLYDRCLERRSLNLGTRAQLAKRIFQFQAKKGGH
ncbi:chondroitin sulfate glucuronyltransferase [Aplysia californica]|uniref:Hexosyltransferase n=1 Tax=Aplysia californica TaxID=6500 RepID=A0ABM1W2G7_APLCA|nr:chondroitin sulfate glucuronyltransferase [Aplysia californica]XP_035828860.1 chondroitin sulfate glucuronyltransferase [Aplysia californica]XP_035828863.1 chondroitin sulfate glucuronyltransferase [Aplysia californica]